ncbi:TPA: type VI secretion system contractile sheath small subunit [Escherichia coli]|nr:type VI secretion system contractile sheath small subunit [Escherichia coli]
MSKKFEGSVAPRERINISYVPKTDGQTAEVELPLNMLVVGDTGNTQETSPLDDFSPDSVARQVPEVNKLLELREALTALKGPMGNLPAFRTQLQALLENEESREQLLKEIGQVSGK